MSARNFNELPLGHRLEIGLGMKEGKDKIDEYLSAEPKDINGWKLSSRFGDRAFYNGNWLRWRPPGVESTVRQIC